MKAVRAIAAVELRRFLRDRSNIFFVFIFPLLLVFVLGLQFGGGGPDLRVAVAGADSALRSGLAEELREDEVSVDLVTADVARTRVARGRADVAVFVTGAAAAAHTAREPVELEVVPSSERGGPAAVERVRTAAARVSSEQRQLDALAAAGVPTDEARTALERTAGHATAPELSVVDVDEVAQEFAGLGQFDLGAAGQLLSFVFLISLAGSTTLIQSRRLGVVGRVLAAPVSATQALLGQALGRWTIAMFQGVYIMLATALLFAVDWGNVWLAGLVLVIFSGVAAGAAMVLGSVLDNENAAVGIGIGLGLVLAALGGSMMPLEIFPDTLRTVAHVTPHAWAYEAFASLQRHDGDLLDVLPQLAVLAAMAAALLALGSFLLRRSTARAL